MKRGKAKRNIKKINSTKKNNFLENNKTTLAIVIAGFFVLALFVMFINNQQNINITGHSTFTENLKKVGKDFSQTLAPILSFLFNIKEGSDVQNTIQNLMGYVLAFVIILGIFWLALNKIDFFQERPAISNTLIIAISLLAVRGIAQLDIIEEIFFPYSVFGVTAITAIPFLAVFVLINMGLKEQPATLRRTLWILFAVVFVVLWFGRRNELETLNWIYFFTAVLAILMAFIDGTIQGFFARIEAEKLENINKADLKGRLREIKSVYDSQFANGQINKKEYKLLIKKKVKNPAKSFGLKGQI
jgi:hypothetical protein